MRNIIEQAVNKVKATISEYPARAVRRKLPIDKLAVRLESASFVVPRVVVTTLGGSAEEKFVSKTLTTMESIMSNRRTELQREVAEALIASKAINFEAVGSLISKYGARAARTGDAIGAIIHWRVIDICIPPDPYQVANFAAIRGADATKG